MTNSELSTIIRTLLDNAEKELRLCRESALPEQQNGWITSMVASKIFSGLAEIFINLKEEARRAQAETPTTKL